MQEQYVCIRCGRKQHGEFTWAHKAPSGHPRNRLRTCGGKVVLESQVEQALADEKAQHEYALKKITDAESGVFPSKPSSSGGLFQVVTNPSKKEESDGK